MEFKITNDGGNSVDIRVEEYSDWRFLVNDEYHIGVRVSGDIDVEDIEILRIMANSPVIIHSEKISVFRAKVIEYSERYEGDHYRVNLRFVQNFL